MDLGRQSNMGSLVSAVLVGLLALASNQYARMDRSALRSFVNNLQARTISPRATGEELDEFELAFRNARSRIQALEKHLGSAFEDWKRGSIRSRDPRLQPIWKAIDNLQTKLNGDEQLWDALPTLSRFSYMWVLFWAGEMNPAGFSQAFLDLSEAMVTGDDKMVGGQAAVLRLYHGLDRSRLDEQKLAENLETFAADNPDDMIGVYMYLIMARDLYERGHQKKAERILRRGIQVFSGHPGSSMLVNELMDQKTPKRAAGLR